MGPYATFLLGACSCIIIYAAIQRFRTASLRRAMITKYGCKVPKKYPHKDPLGLDLFIQGGKQFATSHRLSGVQNLYEEHGNTYQTRAFDKTVINTIDPDNLRAIYAVNFEDFAAQPTRLPSADPAIGLNVFTADGPFWKHARGQVTPIFTRAHLSDLTAFQKHVDKLFTSIPSDGSPFDIMPSIKTLFSDSAMDFLFGASPESQSLGFETEKKDFLDAFEEVLGGIGRRIFRGKLSAVIPDPGFKKACIKAKLFADKYVDAAVERFHHAEGGTKAERYIFLNKMAKQTTDRTYLRNNLLAVFVAGHESTANLLTNCLFLTSRRPDVWKKLRQEVLDVQDKPITFELLKSLRYLHYVLNETLRLYPITLSSRREAIRDTVLPTGGGEDGQSHILVKKGWTVMTNIHALHRRKDIYGDDAEDFKPERWESLRQNWHYVPFSGGPRICPAQQLALTEASYTMYRLLLKFKENRSCDDRPWTENIKVTVSNKNGVSISLIPA